MPDLQAFNELDAPLFHGIRPASPDCPFRAESGGDFAIALVIGRALELETAERGAEFVGHEHAIPFVFQISPEIMDIALLAYYRVAKSDYIAQVFGNSCDNVAGPDIVIPANVGTHEI